MEAKDVVSMIQFYRHDILNHLQIIQGYVKLGKLEKVDTHMNRLFEYFHKERNLLNLDIPNVILWFMVFRKRYDRFELSYTVEIEKGKLSEADVYILEKLEAIMDDIETRTTDDGLYHIHVLFKEKKDLCAIDVTAESAHTGLVLDALPDWADVEVRSVNNKIVYSLEVSTS